jgi:hypothetical protein
MQRVRVGLTGLACVFLLVFLAAAFFGLARPDASAPDAPGTPAAGLDANVAEPREPLAEMGVTPGNLPGQADTPAAKAPAGLGAPPITAPVAGTPSPAPAAR